VEQWGEVVERPAGFDEPGPHRSWFSPVATLDDRRDGRFCPAYESEQDLARIRGAARQLASLTPVAIGALDALANYGLAGGFTFTAHSAFAQPQLVTAAQSVIDEFLDANDFSGGLDRELHHRSREDGEAFVTLAAREDGTIGATVLEPEQIAQPQNPAPLEE